MKIFTKTLNRLAALVGCLLFSLALFQVTAKGFVSFGNFKLLSPLKELFKQETAEASSSRQSHALSKENSEMPPPCIGLSNTGFESSLTGWTTSGTVSTTTTAPYAGARSADITGNGASLSQTYASVVAGKVYVISFYAKLNGSVSGNDVAIRFLNNSNTVLSETWYKISGSAWTAYAASGTAPAGATKVSILFWKYGSTGSLQLDEVCLTETTPVIGECILAQNTGFESGETYWYDDATNTSVTTAQKYSGNQSLQVVGDGAYSYQQFSVMAGQTYELTAWVKTSGSPTYSEIYLDWKDASNNKISDIWHPVVATSNWRKVSLKGKAPAGTAYVAIGAYKTGGTANILYVDDLCFSLINPLGGTIAYEACGCGENRVPNGGFEEVVDTLTFPLSLQGKPTKALEKDNAWAIRPWQAGISGNYMFYVKDIPNTVNNPEGDYFVYLPNSGDCWTGNVHFGNNFLLEDGEQYTFCFYAASWVNNLDANGLPVTGVPTQGSGTIRLEFNVNGSIAVIDEWAVPASESFSNLSWTKYSYTFTYSALQTITGFYLTNSRSGIGTVVDAVSLSKVSCLSERPSCPSGSIGFQRWYGITGTRAEDLTSSADYPTNLDESGTLTSFQGQSNFGDDYGTRVFGYVTPPTTGNYTFTVTSTDRSELFLSTVSGNPSAKTLIASVIGSTGVSEFTKYASQTSAAVSLTGGQKYFIELLHKAGAGTSDHFQVYWQTPSNSTRTIIPGSVLTPVCFDEICGNGTDDDMDAVADCADSDCTAAAPGITHTTTAETCGSTNSGAIDLTTTGTDTPYSFRWADLPESAWWTFERNTQDNSGNSRHDNGVTGTIIWSTDAVEGNYAAYFDGTSNIRYSVDNAFMEVAFSKLSVSMWVKPDNLTGVKTLFEEGGSNTNSGRGLSLYLNGSTVSASIRNGSNTLYTASAATAFPADGNWHHIVVVFNAGALTTFLDGVPGTTSNTGVTSVGAHSNNGGIATAVSGSVSHGSGNSYKGKMDDVRYFFDRALTNGQVAEFAARSGDRSNIAAGSYSVTVANASGCTNSLTITVSSGANFTSGGSVSGDETDCSGTSFNPTLITSSSDASGGTGGTTEYKWQLSTNSGTTWTDIASTNTATYDPPAISVNTQYRRAARRNPCTGWVYSNVVTKSLGTNLTSAGTLAGAETGCGAYNPSPITETAPPAHPTDWYFKIDPPVAGSSNGLTWTLAYYGGEPLWIDDVEGDFSNLLQIQVKSGVNSLYYSYPPFDSLYGPINPNSGRPYGISHFNFWMEGGTTETSYQWQRSTNGGTTWEDIPGASARFYDPDNITATTSYRRCARREPCQTCLYTNTVTKTVTGGLTDPGMIVGEEESCGSFDPDIIASVTPASGSGNPTIEYKWQKSENNGTTWTDIAATNSQTYNAPTIVATTLYRRGARPNTCSSWIFTDAVRKMVALNITSAGSISGDESICGSYDAGLISSVSPASGGVDGYLTYRWQLSTDGGTTWTEVSGADQATYDPGVLAQTTTYRRQALRTPCNIWVSTNPVTKTVRTVPVANITGFPTTTNGFLCELTTYQFSAAEGGAGATYSWNFGSYASPATASGKGPHNVSFNVPNSPTSTTVTVNLSVNISGCVQTASKSFNFRPQIQNWGISYTDPPSCSSNQGSISVVGGYPSGTTAQASIDGAAWVNFSSNTANFTNLPAGVFPVYARYSGGECQTFFDYATLSDPPDPAADITVSSTSVCVGTGFSVSATGSATMSYTWDFGAGASPATATGAGPHTVTYTTQGAKTISLTLQSGACFGFEEQSISAVGNFTTPAVIIGDELLCSTTTNPSTITTSSSPSGGYGGSATYKWQRRTSNGMGGWNAWTDISGASGSSYDPPPITVSSQYRRGARRSPCADWLFTNEVTKSLSSMPIAVADYYESACPGFIYFNNVSYNDQQLASPVYTLTVQPFNGTVDMDTDGEFVYTPNSTFCGTDQFSYRVCNQFSGCCQTANVVIDLSDPEAPILQGIPEDLIVHCDEEVPLPPLVEAYENCQSVTIGLDVVSTQGDDSCSIYSYDMTRIWTGLDYCGNSAVDQQQISIQDLTSPDIFRVYTLPNGKKMVAGVMENVTKRWKTVGFPIQFAFPPVVFTQVTSQNENSAVVTRLRNVSTTQFQLRLQEEESSNSDHQEEMVSWIAIEQGAWNGSPSGAGGGSEIPFEVVRRLTNSMAVSFPLGQTYATAPGMIGTIQTFNENNPAAMRFPAVTSTHVTAYVEEEKSLDAEILHGFETVGYLALGGIGDVKTNTGEVVGETGRLTLDHNFITINLSHVYHNPVVVLGGLSKNDNAPATIRVKNVTSTSFSVQVDEWDYLDGTHGSESVTYIVIEGSLPFDQRVECSSIPAPLGIGTEIFARDNCDQTIALTMLEGDLEFACDSDSIFTRTWSVRDECGNETVLTQTYILTDTTPPTFTVPANMDIVCSQDKDDLGVTGDVTDESDNCSEGIEATYSDNLSALEGCFGFITRTWTLVDNCGNTTLKVQHLYVSPDNDGDLDMRPDITDWDDDNDGIPDIHEGGGDNDNDGIANYLDRDNDNDGITDLLEAGFRDSDGDGRVDNYLQTNWDNDGDGYAIEFDANDGDASIGASVIFNPADRDFDGDGIPNYFDRDSDNDGIPDIVEVGGADENGDGELDYPIPGDATSMLDNDGDGLANEYDSDDDEQQGAENQTAPLAMRDTDGTFDSGTPGWTTDTDLDGTPDFLDRDSDNDGIPDLVENGGVDEDGDGTIDSTEFTDADGNGLDDQYETLPLVKTEPVGSNADGRPSDGNGDNSPYETGDADLDGIPNSRDTDADNDSIPDIVETGNRLLDTDGDGVIDPEEFLDTDHDGCCDDCEGAITTDPDGTVNDGRPEDSNDSNPTTLRTRVPDGAYGKQNDIPDVDDDGDGIANFLDTDSDNDSLPDIVEDRNFDGVVDSTETGTLIPDTDEDGILDGVEDSNQSGSFEQGIETNPIYSDTDNDGLTDGFEDWNFDGNVDTLESDPRNPCDPNINAACVGVALRVKVKLAGAMMNNGGGTLMRDDLRAKGYLPLTEPYSNIATFGHKGEGGGETTTPEVLAVTGENAIVDWVYIELRPVATPSLVVATRAALLQRDGDVVDVDGVSEVMFEQVPSGSYYVVSRHRNHLGVATGTGLIVSPAATSIDYTSINMPSYDDFDRQAWNGSLVMWAGDTNNDRKIVYQGPWNDVLTMFFNVLASPGNDQFLANYINYGYTTSDLNMDGSTIYQGPNNDRARMLNFSVLSSPENVNLFANFVLTERLP